MVELLIMTGLILTMILTIPILLLFIYLSNRERRD